MEQMPLVEKQIIRILLREAESSEPSIVADIKKNVISEKTFYFWRRKFELMDVSDSKRLRELEQKKRTAQKGFGRGGACKSSAEVYQRKNR